MKWVHFFGFCFVVELEGALAARRGFSARVTKGQERPRALAPGIGF